METKNKPIIINGWQAGISSSGEEGFADMRNVNIDTLPGVLMNSFSAVKQSGTTITGMPMWFVANTDAAKTVYCLDNSGKVYSTDRTSSWATWAQVAGNTTTAAHGNGLAIFNNYLIVARDAILDAYGPLDSSPSWKTDFLTTASLTAILSDTSVHPMFVSTNGTLYIGNGVDATNKLGSSIISISQKAGQVFDPTNSTKYNYNNLALQLPYPYRIRCLSQYGNNLMVGTFIGTTNSGDIISDIVTNPIAKIADIFPWDRVSATYNLPIRLFENGINALLTIGNTMYIQAGQWGQFYTYNGYLAQPFFEFPHNTTAGQYQGGAFYPTIVYPGAIMYHQSRIYFGLTEGNSSLGASGVYSVQLDGKGLVMDNLVSSGTSKGTTFIGALLPHLDGASQLSYMIGWQDVAAQGVDLVASGNAYSSDYNTTIVDTKWHEIGTADFPGTLQRGMIHLEENLLSGDGVKVGFRYDKTTLTFTDLFTFDFTTYPNKAEIGFPAGNITGRKVQFRISLIGQPRVQNVTFPDA